MADDVAWQIKSFEWTHNCSRALKNKNVSATWLARRYIETFMIAPKWDVKLFKATVLREYGVEISDTKAWRARRFAEQLLKESLVGQFGLLGSYAAEVRRTNPGLTIILSLDELEFKGIYICFDACKKGFLGGCRPVIRVDGCFLKGDWGGQLLVAVGIDENDCMFPIAHAVVEIENNVSWSWFLRLLGEDLGIESAYGLTFMTDRQKGLEHLVTDIFPLAEHRFCVRHMYSNFFRKDFKSLKLRDFLWKAARFSYIAEFNYWMDKLQKEDEAAWAWMCCKPAHQWSKSHFQIISKCDILLNNLYECFNNYIKDVRGKDILNLLQGIQNKLMVRMYKRRELVARTVGDVCPKIVNKLEVFKQESFSWKALYNGEMQFQVSGPHSNGQFVVDLQAKMCACRRWDLSGVPCPHAIASMREWGKDSLQLVDECYKVSTYMKAYEHCIYPINGKKMWPPSGFEPVKPPRWVTKKRGRKQTKRRKGVEEAFVAKEKTKKLGKRGDGKKKMTCTVCRQKGHDKRFHLKGDSQPNSTQHKAGQELGDGTSVGVRSRVAEHVVHSQPATMEIMQQESLYFFSQPVNVIHDTTSLDITRTNSKRKGSTPRRRLTAVGNSLSTTGMKK